MVGGQVGLGVGDDGGGGQGGGGGVDEAAGGIGLVEKGAEACVAGEGQVLAFVAVELEGDDAADD